MNIEICIPINRELDDNDQIALVTFMNNCNKVCFTVDEGAGNVYLFETKEEPEEELPSLPEVLKSES